MLWLYRQLYGGGLRCDLGKVWVLFPGLGWPRLTLVTPWHTIWTWASVPGPPPHSTTGNAFGAAEIHIQMQTCCDQAPRAVLWLCAAGGRRGPGPACQSLWSVPEDEPGNSASAEYVNSGVRCCGWSWDQQSFGLGFFHQQAQHFVDISILFVFTLLSAEWSLFVYKYGFRLELNL